MLPKFISPFKGEGAQEEKQKQQLKKKKKKLNNQKRKSSTCDDDGGRRSQTTMDIIGLRLVAQITNLQTKSNNVVVKSAIRKANHTNSASTTSSTPLDSCFLKTCSLCNRKLRHDKDIYMYRGDQGFCSIECRNRQIVMDEMRELEGSKKQRASSSSYRNCWNDARRETRLILEDLRLQRLQSKSIPSCAHHENHWAILS